MIKATNKLTGKLNASIIHVYPELEDVTITPQLEEQKLKSEKYGFENVVVKGIPATDLKLEPSFEEQIKEGIFKKVEVGAIPQQTLDIIPTEEEQTEKGLFTEVNIGAIQAVEVAPELNFDATDTIIVQGQDGTYIKKLTINKDINLTPDNIKTGVTVFGIEGGVADTTDATATANDLVVGTTAYVNNEKVTGTIPDNGALEFDPSDEEQEIPSGLTTGGLVKATDITTLNEYNACLTLANSIEVFEDYTETTTATAQDIKKGMTAYSNGERITGTLEVEGNGTKNIKNGYNLFADDTAITEMDTFNCTSLTGAYQMFMSCSNMTKAILSNPIKITTFNRTFQGCTSLKIAEIKGTMPERSVDASSMFNNCRVIETIILPVNFAPYDMSYIFNNCQKLKTPPVFDMSNATTITSCFARMAGLSDEGLNNILLMLTNATKFTGTKTLAHAGLTSDQATRCQSLSNWEAFVSAGWSTGY